MKTVKDILGVSGKDYIVGHHKDNHKGYPPEKDMPTVLIFKRKAIRTFPDNQKIGLYYSQALDKYLSVPFGPQSKHVGLNLNESEKAEKSRIKSNIDILHRAGLHDIAAQYDKHQSTIGPEGETAEKILKRIAAKITPQNFDKLSPKGKKALLPHMKKIISPEKGLYNLGMWHGTVLRSKLKRGGKDKSDVTHPEPAKPKDEIISKLSDWKPTEKPKEIMLPKPGTKPPPALAESFQAKLKTIREEHLIERSKAGDIASEILSNIFKKGGGAVDDIAGMSKEASKLAKQRQGGFINKLREKIKQRNQKKQLEKQRKEIEKARRQRGNKDGGGKVSAGLSALAAIGGAAGKAAEASTQQTQGDYAFSPTAGVAVGSTSGQTAIAPQRERWKYRESGFVQESTISQIKDIVNNNIKSKDVVINESTVVVSNRVAKKILHVYESLNKTNRKKLEKMLNEDVSSFRKAINFAIRQ